MPAIKRKRDASKGAAVSPIKKTSANRHGNNAKIRSKLEETETDSDPIVESDTTDQSGSDNGVSWPSEDDEGEEQDVPEGDDDDGGVKLPIRNHKPLKDGVPKDDQTANGFKLGKEFKYQNCLVVDKYQTHHQGKHTPNRKRSHKSEKPLSQAQITLQDPKRSGSAFEDSLMFHSKNGKSLWLSYSVLLVAV